MGVVLTKSGRGSKIFTHASRAAIILPQLKFDPSYALDMYGVVYVMDYGKGYYFLCQGYNFHDMISVTPRVYKPSFSIIYILVTPYLYTLEIPINFFYLI